MGPMGFLVRSYVQVLDGNLAPRVEGGAVSKATVLVDELDCDGTRSSTPKPVDILALECDPDRALRVWKELSTTRNDMRMSF